MTAQIFTGGEWRTITSGKIYLGGAWRTITRGSVYKGGGWKDGPAFVPPLSATASPSDVSGSDSSHITILVVSGFVTVTPVGGLPPYTYRWVANGGTNPTNGSSATTAFSKFLAPHAEILTDATCTVTDALGATAEAPVSSIDLINEG